MRRFALRFGFFTAFAAIAACDDGPDTCPMDPPFEAGADMSSLQFAPMLTGSHAPPKPLSCAYFDRCGETVCTATDE